MAAGSASPTVLPGLAKLRTLADIPVFAACQALLDCDGEIAVAAPVCPGRPMSHAPGALLVTRNTPGWIWTAPAAHSGIAARSAAAPFAAAPLDDAPAAGGGRAAAMRLLALLGASSSCNYCSVHL